MVFKSKHKSSLLRPPPIFVREALFGISWRVISWFRYFRFVNRWSKNPSCNVICWKMWLLFREKDFSSAWLLDASWSLNISLHYFVPYKIRLFKYFFLQLWSQRSKRSWKFCFKVRDGVINEKLTRESVILRYYGGPLWLLCLESWSKSGAFHSIYKCGRFFQE